jgi:hypothetical protein
MLRSYEGKRCLNTGHLRLACVIVVSSFDIRWRRGALKELVVLYTPSLGTLWTKDKAIPVTDLGGGGEWSASISCRFTPVTHSIQG